ncbi:MAG: CoA transferase [Gammaproteobacteria bacterium]|nr:CoA transferase [Gammaproteobacteria bacterium]
MNPLKGILNTLRILDFSTLLPGPYASLLLADMGADVIKVESPNAPDWLRALPFLDNRIRSIGHEFINRSKRSLSLDLKAPQAFEVLSKLLSRYDILIESFRPGTKERLNLGEERLRAINPNLILCSITGYGQESPYRDKAGHDNNFLALSGLMSYSGRKSGGPTPIGTQIADLAGGSQLAVMGILAAVIHRLQTGEGQSIDISLADGAFALNGLAAAGWLTEQDLPKPENHLINGGGFYDYHRTKDGRYLSVAPLEEKFWKPFCIAIGRPDLQEKSAEKQWTTHTEGAIREEIKTVISSRTFEEWVKLLGVMDVCVEPVLNLQEACLHPHYQARKMVINVEDEKGGSYPQLACPIRFSKTEPTYRFIGARLGEHNQAILKELGYSKEEIQRLEQKGVIG